MTEDMDTLRDKLNETTELAKLLFEQQFIRLGGRKPADPQWSDLDESERDEWWDRALDAGPLIEAARRSSMFAAVSGYQLAEKDMDLLLWLHAEAVWEAHEQSNLADEWFAEGERLRGLWPQNGLGRDTDVRQLIANHRAWTKAAHEETARERSSRQAWAEEADEWTDIAQHWFDKAHKLLHDYDALTLELTRKWGHKKQVEFVAFVEESHPFVPRGWQIDTQPGELRFTEPQPICACVPDAEAAALVGAGFTRPQCTVHPDEDARLLAVAEARAAVDTGERISLEDAAAEFGVDLSEPEPSSVHPDGGAA